MKLTQPIIDKIQNITQVAQLVGIDSVIIEKEMVRAINDEKVVMIFHSEDIDLPFGAIALNRLSSFASRLELAQAGEKFEIEAVTGTDEEYAKSLVMKNKKSKIEYRCANPSVIKAPRQIQDTMKVQVTLTPSDVNTLAKAVSAMGADMVEIISDSKGAQFKMTDINKDAFTHDITDLVKAVAGSKEDAINFTWRYPAKILLQIFKKQPDSTFMIGTNGLLNIAVSGINLFIIPQV